MASLFLRRRRQASARRVRPVTARSVIGVAPAGTADRHAAA